MFWGYFDLGGNELVNHARFDSYLKNQLQGQSWFHDPDDNGDLMKALGDTEYASPLQDDAPWLDANDPATQRFFGCYLISASGFGDSTRTATVTQSMFDGGTVASVRRATGQFTMKLLLAAADETAMESGVTWLRNALDRANCRGGCDDDELTYFIDIPRENYIFPDAAAGVDGPIPSMIPGSTFQYPGSFSEDRAFCSLWRWQPTITEGVQVQYGVFVDGVLADESDQIILQRTNQAVNPSFQRDTSWWSGTGLNRVEAGGVDDLAYGNIPGVEDVASHIETAAVDASTTDRALTIWLRSESGTMATITYDTTTTDVRLTDQWQRLSMLIPANVSAPVQVDLVETGVGFDIDQVMIEQGTDVRPYFDGDFTQDGYEFVWLGSNERSQSRVTYVDQLASRENVTPGQTSSGFFTVLTGNFPGGRFDYGFSAVPADQWVDAVTRSVLSVTATSGPTLDEVLQINDRDCGVARTYDIVLTTEVPYAFSPGVEVAGGLLSDPVPFDDTDVTCDVGVPTPVVDPDCPPIPPAPRPPVISLVCSDTDDTSWERYFVNVPQDTVAATATSVPLLDLTTLNTDVRSVRVRMHPNPFNYEPQDVDPCSFCSEFVISYLPANTVLSMDGRTKQATVNVAASGSQQASTLLFGSNGTPITWPELSCGIPYVMTVDIPEGTVDEGAQTPFEVDLSMVRRE